MDGRRYSVCQCACDKTDSTHNFYKSTFGFYDGNWRCEKNSALRRRSGCQLSLDQKGINDPILTVPTTITDGNHLISNVTMKKHISIPEEATCSLKDGNSMYLTCSGMWKELTTALVTKRFNLHLIHNWKDINVGVEVDYTEDSSYPLPSGRIIKLAVTCSDRPWEPSQCILLKIQGRLQCSVSPLLSTSPPAQPPVPIRPTSVPSMTSQSPTTSSYRAQEKKVI
uniref:Uncharacterized protein LOC116291582 isoform X3 n=1 Tax=Actinia tenebrosa TaxID=6105 RepID=A0A6P8HFN9_ACTTE